MVHLASRMSLPTLIVTVALSGCVSGETELREEDLIGEEEVLSRTEFTNRIENFFEYTALGTGEPSEFLIHLTDLSDGSPVGQAEVDLTVLRPGSDTELESVRALVGRVTGIYVAELIVAEPGRYDIRFHIRSGDIDETMRLTGFEVN